MILLCECCSKPIERLDDIKLTHRSGCEPNVLSEPMPEPELRDTEPLKDVFPDIPSIIILPDGRMDPKNAAQYIGTTVGALGVMRCRSEGPKFVKLGRKVFYYKARLDEWINRFGDMQGTTQAQALKRMHSKD